MSEHPLSILHVLAPADVGGLETVVQLLATGHRRSGHCVHVAAVSPGDGARRVFLPALRAAGVDVASLDIPGRAYHRERAEVGALCRSLRPAVVHTHGYRCDTIAAGAARALGIPTVTTVHGFTGGGARNWFYERLQRFAFRRFDAVVAVSRPIADRLTRDGVRPERLHFVQNAYAARELLLDRAAARAQLGVAPDGFRVGWVGRLSLEKGADVLVDALAHLADVADLAVSVLGEGDQRSELCARARERGVEHRITWHGVVPDAGRLLRAFDVLVLSSRTEGTPMVVLEAMAAGVPIVASRVGGVPDVLSSADALLVPSEDAAALATAIREVHDRPGGARGRADSARRRLDTEFALAPWLARYEAIYRQIQRSPTTPRS
jgi:glycosyltransferase involved in cell wall biosynthesis